MEKGRKVGLEVGEKESDITYHLQEPCSTSYLTNKKNHPEVENPNQKTTKSANGNPDDDLILLQPFDYIRSLPSKHLRLKLSLAFNYWMKVDEDRMEKIYEIVDLLHNASLLVDDMEDGSDLRRGQPTAHAIFGIPRTMNAANYVYVISLERSLSLGHPQAAQVFMEQMLELHRGQGMELYWRELFTCPMEQQYIDTVVKKTTGLFMMSLRLMQLFSDDKRDFYKLVSLLGLFFQIRDDYANFMLEEYTESKSFCEDLTEGKFSFPIIHAITQHPENVEVSCILKQRPTNISLKKRVVQLLDKLGSISYTESKLRQLADEIRKEIKFLGGNPFLESFVEGLISKVFNKK